jgi:hypothetical protein
MSKAQVLEAFKSEYWWAFNGRGGVMIAKNEMFWEFVDGLVKSGMVTQIQRNRWANPFKSTPEICS